MSWTLVYRDLALVEADEAAHWYENSRTGLGHEFLDTLRDLLKTIHSQPKRYAIVIDDVRVALMQRFPYCVYYRVSRNKIIIVAVFHTSRDPATWQGHR